MKDKIDSNLKRREPALIKTAQEYNSLCEKIATQIRKHQAPVNAIAPLKINIKELWKLDIDDDIWQDVGLDENGEGPVPRWAGHEGTRVSIKALLEVDRCKEEEARLRRERCILQEFAVSEWGAIMAAGKIAKGLQRPVFVKTS